ncbi:hypothetical protein Psta_0719 [Pirellula staleyi DSM 6068]|uniref:Uncharacterized protein n=1 Tax=Pirellula staleyi (strain ATCC 27377 / DSM 6068 / ICPB 4128) TaxID=530564 RepID=D2R5E6_PIRSD|nr:hypothetical protein Psta_0719 [Pirellula staleyi DSM 6068]
MDESSPPIAALSKTFAMPETSDSAANEQPAPMFYPQRIVLIQIEPPHPPRGTPLSKAVGKTGMIAPVESLVKLLGKHCRLSDYQWLVATNEPTQAIHQELVHAGLDNVLVMAMQIEIQWRCSCLDQSPMDQRMFGGVAHFFEELRGDDSVDSSAL